MTKKKQAQQKTKRIPKDITVSISVDPELRRAISERAELEDRSSSYLVRKATEQYLRLQSAPAELRKAIEQFIGVQQVAA
jgi:hypothetical protein